MVPEAVFPLVSKALSVHDAKTLPCPPGWVRKSTLVREKAAEASKKTSSLIWYFAGSPEIAPESPMPPTFKSCTDTDRRFNWDRNWGPPRLVTASIVDFTGTDMLDIGTGIAGMSPTAVPTFLKAPDLSDPGMT